MITTIPDIVSESHDLSGFELPSLCRTWSSYVRPGFIILLLFNLNNSFCFADVVEFAAGFADFLQFTSDKCLLHV